MKSNLHAPVVGIPCDAKEYDRHIYHSIGEKYIEAVRRYVGAFPLMIPVLNDPLSSEQIFSLVDGLMFTGSVSNVAPHHYGGDVPREGVLQDHQRDATTLPLIREAIERQVPIFCICRGFQELNVTFGGTLHQHLHEIDGRNDHREPEVEDHDIMYGPRHPLKLVQGGFLANLLGEETIMVNSLHHQGIADLAPGLVADAYAEDGTIEAVTVAAAKAFAFGVQWHPEWKPHNNIQSQAIFHAFGKAVTQASQDKRE